MWKNKHVKCYDFCFGICGHVTSSCNRILKVVSNGINVLFLEPKEDLEIVLNMIAQLATLFRINFSFFSSLFSGTKKVRYVAEALVSSAVGGIHSRSKKSETFTFLYLKQFFACVLRCTFRQQQAKKWRKISCFKNITTNALSSMSDSQIR